MKRMTGRKIRRLCAIVLAMVMLVSLVPLGGIYAVMADENASNSEIELLSLPELETEAVPLKKSASISENKLSSINTLNKARQKNGIEMMGVDSVTNVSADEELTISADETKTLTLDDFEISTVEEIRYHVKFKFVPEKSGVYLFTSYSSATEMIAIYNKFKDCIDSTDEIVNPNDNFNIYYDFTAGQVYYFKIILSSKASNAETFKASLETQHIHENITHHAATRARCYKDGDRFYKTEYGYSDGDYCLDCESYLSGNYPKIIEYPKHIYTDGNTCSSCGYERDIDESGKCGDNVEWTLDREDGLLIISGDGDMYDYDEDTSPFYNNQNISIIEFVGNITSIGDYAFESCYYLYNVYISESVTKIGDNAFDNCHSLVNVNLPKQLTSIGKDAFFACIGYYGSIDIPASVKKIGNNAFYRCPVTEFRVEEANPYYSNDEIGVLFNKNKTVLISYPSGSSAKSYKIPETVTSIDDYIFSYCDNIETLEISNSVTSIGNFAFAVSRGIEHLKLSDNLNSIGDGAFVDCNLLEELVIPGSVKQMGKCLSGSMGTASSLKRLTIKSGANIGEASFAWCGKLKELIIEDGVTNIGVSAFAMCHSIEDLIIPGSVKAIGMGAFMSCSSFKSLKILEGVETIGNNAFAQQLVTSYANPNSGFILELPGSVKSIGTSAFDGCNIKGLNLKEGLESIGEGAFMACTKLTGEIKIAKSVTSIGQQAFAYTNIASFNVDSQNPNYSNDEQGTLFDKNKTILIKYPTGCEYTSYTVPASVEKIEALSFSPSFAPNYDEEKNIIHTTLEALTVSENLKIVGGFAFEGCVKLTDVYYNGTPHRWLNIDIKQGNDPFTSANIHYTSTDEDKHIFVKEVTREATCVYDGEMTYTCVCGESYTESIPAIGHKDVTDWIVEREPTCTQGGYKEKRCNICNYIVESEYSDPLPHADKDADGRCDTCRMNISVSCSCNCHKSGFMGFIWKIINFFNKLFRSKQYCACGAKHW